MCVGYYTAGHTHEHAHTFWQTSALSHTSLMFRHKYLRMLPGSQIVSWKPDLIYTSFWCILILHYIEVVKKGNKWRSCFNFAWEYSLQPTLWHIYISSVKIHWVAGREPKKVMLRIDHLHLYWDCFWNLILIKNICLYLKYLVEKLESLHNWLWQ